MDLKYKIVADSSSDVLSLSDIPFASAPLTIQAGRISYTDNASLNVEHMVQELASVPSRTSTACPSVGDWLDAFGQAENIFCLTITSALSGSYSSAMTAKDIYEHDHPGRNVLVIDTRSTGPEMRLLIEAIARWITEGLDFLSVCGEIVAYQARTGLLFLLQSVKNLANNGRISHLAAKAVGLLGLNLLGKASAEGTLELHGKCRGEKRAPPAILQLLHESGYAGGRLRISHCMNEPLATALRAQVALHYPAADIAVYPCRGLCSYYAEKGGILVGFERP